MTLTEIPPSFEFAEKDGEDGVSLDQTTAGEKGKKALLSQALKNTMFFMCIYKKKHDFSNSRHPKLKTLKTTAEVSLFCPWTFAIACTN